jgi:predicted  nucleic acid-binding Zn-ribbon protein
MKRLNPAYVIIACLSCVLIYQQLFLGKTYKREYERMLKEKEESYLKEIGKLESEADSLLQLNLSLSTQIADIDNKIDSTQTRLTLLRKKYEDQVDEFSDMSHDDLITAFTNAFK